MPRGVYKRKRHRKLPLLDVSHLTPTKEEDPLTDYIIDNIIHQLNQLKEHINGQT
jgi:hypothetical protein